jgi:acetyl esterase/lipase
MRAMTTCLLTIAAMMATAGNVPAADEDRVQKQSDIVYLERDGVKLSGDLYLPKGREKAAPVLVAVHGGGWQAGSREIYKYWGPFLAKNGMQSSPSATG